MVHNYHHNIYSNLILFLQTWQHIRHGYIFSYKSEKVGNSLYFCDSTKVNKPTTCFSQFPGSLSVPLSLVLSHESLQMGSQVCLNSFLSIGALQLLAVVIQTGVSIVNKTVTTHLPVTVVKQQENKQQTPTQRSLIYVYVAL